jgi:RNA 3'-terminal phosphate cyclase-like protein
MRYKPGFIHAGSGLEHDCGTSRAIGYFLEPLACIALWAKRSLAITLRGITNDAIDCGVDMWRTVTLPLLRQVTGADDGFELKIVKRGAPPGGGGEVFLRLPTLKQLPPINMVEEGDGGRGVKGGCISCMHATAHLSPLHVLGTFGSNG